MKTIIIALMSMITTMIYAQSSDEIEVANSINNLVTTNIPDLIGKDYCIFDATDADKFIISKINNSYTSYMLHINRGPGVQITSKAIPFNPILDKIFTNFAPKADVKRYLSDYGHNTKEHILSSVYFSIYKNGVKTFDYFLSPSLDNNSIECPIDEEILSFLYISTIPYLIPEPEPR
jgi:hypothetical protein